MPQKIAVNLEGRRFGTLTAISRGLNSDKIEAMWHCECDCGTKKFLSAWRLTGGTIKSCGCLKNELISTSRRKAPGYSGMRQLILQYKRSAKKKNHSYELSIEAFQELTSDNCHYCNAPPSRVRSNGGRAHAAYTYNGIDRKDNTLGYVLENCVSCCFTCNDWKSDMSYEEFLSHIGKIFKNRTSF